MIAAEGILTSRGGLVSHAAVVARGMGKPAICGAEAVKIDLKAKQFTAGDVVVKEGDIISISGTTGEIALGEVPVVTPEPTGHFATVLGFADQFRRLKVRTNADTPEDSARARAFGAEGIGLCRTEHMFLGEDRVAIVRRMILSDNQADEQAALDELEVLQKADFVGILEAMDGLPVTVRLLDPPLHEFLPDTEELAVKQATEGLSRRGGEAAAGRPLLAGGQPDAGHPGLPPRHHQARPVHDAGPGPHGSGRGAQAGRRRPPGRDHDPAGRLRPRAGRS